jgi:hypothetical protein
MNACSEIPREGLRRLEKDAERRPSFRNSPPVFPLLLF